MALVATNTEENGTVWALWRIDEPSDELLQKYAEKKGPIPDALTQKKDQVLAQSLAARLALAACTDISALSTSSNGEPRIPHGFVSLSHTTKYGLAAFHPEFPVGIDLEGPRPQILRIADKFSTSEERSRFTKENLEAGLLILWTCKEAVFKAYGKGDVDFKVHIQVTPFDPADQGQLIVHFGLDPQAWQVHYSKWEDLTITLALARPQPIGPLSV
jgi:4'-phosphopantetheinyl transferase